MKKFLASLGIIYQVLSLSYQITKQIQNKVDKIIIDNMNILKIFIQ